MDLELKGKVALVTGASYGIGAAIAKGLAQEGVKLAICARGQERLKQVSAELEASGVEVLSLVADVLKPGDIDTMVEQVLAKYGQVDILVNNAGGMVRGTFAKASVEDWQLGIDLNLYSTIRVCQKIIPGMRQKKWGRIINVASVWGHQPGATPIYNTVKGAIITLSKSLSNELAADNILVNAVCPGGIITPAWIETAEILARKRGTTWQEEISKLGRDWAPLGRFGTAEEVANVVVFLASAKASYMTGVAVNIDGGTTKSIL